MLQQISHFLSFCSERDESVAIGAAIQGSILSGDGGDLTNVILLDVAPLSLGTGKSNLVSNLKTSFPKQTNT